MSRFRSVRLALVGLLLAAAAAPVLAQANASGLPLAKSGPYAALLLDQGLLLQRLDGGAPEWLFAYGVHDGKTPHLHIATFASAGDEVYAVASLTRYYRFAAADVRTLKAFIGNADLSKNDGAWVGLDKQDAYALAADPAMGELGDRLGAALIYLDATKNLRQTASSLVATTATLCGAVDAVRGEVGQAATVTQAAHLTTATGATAVQFDSAAFSLKAALYCAGAWPPKPGTIPAFPPATPTFTPPTGPVKWSGTGCGADEIGDRKSCIQSDTGDLCTCECTSVGSTGASWKPDPATCKVIPVTPGPGVPAGPGGTPPAGPGACSPVGGDGPCTNTSGKTCICPCVAAPTGTGGVWGTPSSCGSAELALIFAAIAGLVCWRRR